MQQLPEAGSPPEDAPVRKSAKSWVICHQDSKKLINPWLGFQLLTEFIHEPYSRVHVRDVIKLTLDDLITMMSTLESGTAYWADGVLFASFAMTDSEELAKKEIGGETYVDKIIFTRHERFSKTIKSSTNLEIGVLNVQKSGLYRDLIAWLKLQPIWNQ